MRDEPSGVIVIDKPVDITSARVVDILKRTLNIRKVGHSGTLDPFATGVLVCCLNKATRLARFFLKGEKRYAAVLHLGIQTDTQDATGTIVAPVNDVRLTHDAIRSVIHRFEGASLQRPPAFSALKHQGTPLYRLARGGKPFQKPAREIFISSIDILDVDLPFVRFDVSCSSGTYVRTLCADIGNALGCGGHLKTLRRIESSGFSIIEALPLSRLAGLVKSGRIWDRVIGLADALREMPHHTADIALSEKIRHGKRLSGNDFRPGRQFEMPGFIKVVDDMNNLCAVLDVNATREQYEYCCVFH